MEALTLKQQPCFGAATVMQGQEVVQVVRGDTFTYVNSESKQTSMCKTGQASDPEGKALCWVQATFKGITGWLPIARGTFSNALCDATNAQAESFVAQCASEALAQCRTVVAAGGLDVYAKQCSSAAFRLSKHLDKCSQFDFILGSKTSSSCGDGKTWLGIRYREETIVNDVAVVRQQLGWVAVGADNAYVAECPADACSSETKITAANA
jgi:hypothetical protein